MHKIKGGITTPKGFKAEGQHVGLKRMRKDLAIVVSDKKAIYSGTFTTNIVKASCVQWNLQRYQQRNGIKAIVINSGNANACTGEIGKSHTVKMAQKTAEVFKVNKENILVASTGVIGVKLPIDQVLLGIDKVARQVSATYEAGHKAAEAIRTTDTFTKEIAVELLIGGQKVIIGGMAKGSGMIHPNMATMLAFITTDVTITQELLDEALKADVDETYNMISVDGDTSTNDMVMVLANGKAGNPIIKDKLDPNYKLFKKALNRVNKYLAQQIIHDGEGITKVIEVNIQGAKDSKEASILAKAVINSNLVKTAFFGSDANWGRVICAMGYSGAKFNPEKVSLNYESKQGVIQCLDKGLAVIFDEEKANRILQEKEIKVNIVLEEGRGQATAWGCDLSYDYVKINGEYRS